MFWSCSILLGFSPYYFLIVKMISIVVITSQFETLFKVEVTKLRSAAPALMPRIRVHQTHLTYQALYSLVG